MKPGSMGVLQRRQGSDSGIISSPHATNPRGKAARLGSLAQVRNRYGSLLEGGDRRGFIVFNIKDGVELGDLQQVMHFLGQVEQFQFAALVADGCEPADQFADTGAVNVSDVAKVEQDLLMALPDHVANGVAQYNAAFAEGDTPTQVNDRDAVYLACACFHRHWEASLWSDAAAWTRLINVISVPGSSFRNRTSSMKARMRKMPRPDCFNKFSGARGSATLSTSSPAP